MQEVRCFVLPVANLHANCPVIEIWLKFEGREQEAFDQARLSGFGQLISLSREVSGQAMLDGDRYPAGSAGAARLLADLGLGLQRAAGHDVDETQVLAGRDDAEIRFVVEYDHVHVARQCCRIAQQIVEAWLGSEGFDRDALAALKASFQEVKAEAIRAAMPADARVLIRAARQLGIPWYRMDREPFDPIEGDFRLRPHGLLRFGHGRHRRTLDGVFCIERLEHWHGLVRHRSRRLAWLKQAPVMLWDTQEQPCLGLARARRLRSRLNGPVWVETEHSDGLIRTAAIDDEGQLAATVEQRLAAHGELLIGQVPAGRRLDVLWIMGKVLGVRDGQQLVSPNDPQDRVAELDVVCARLAESLGTGCLSVALIDSPQGWQVLDFDLNPRLDHFIGDRDELLAAAVDLLGWLFPDGGQGRIPIIAVTGTNGKTTTCHMVEAILRQAGYRTGMATSLGSRVNGAWISQLEDGFLPGHLAILGHPEVDVAVLESTRGGARSVGLGFDHCTLSACLNVAAEHLNDELGLRSVDELAELKQWIALRAKKGVVFNYDNPYPRAMIDQAGDRPVTVVSLDRTAAELTETLPKVSALCTLEQHHGRSWLMVTDASGTRPIVAVEDIPMTLQGLARFNVSNAAHAVALGKALGVDEASIATGLRHLRPDFESLPGRLNLYQVGDFRVLYDYAHNPHGIAAVMEIVDRLPVRGCRRVNFSVTGTRSDDFAREVAALIAGHFDDYICTNYAAIYHRRPDEIPTILRAELLAQGIEADRIRTIENADDAIAASLASAQPGDLVVFLVGKTLRAQWKLIEAFGEISPVDPATIGSMPAPGQSA